MSLEQYERWEFEQSLAEDLIRAYRSNAQLRATKVELLRKVDAIDKRLAKNTKAQEVLEDPKYADLEIRHDAGFLRKMEELSAEKVLKSRKNKNNTDDSEQKEERKKLSAEEKMLWLINYLVEVEGIEPSIASITKQLEKEGLISGGSATQWLKPLGLPQNALRWVSAGNRRKGKRLVWKASADLKRALKEHGIDEPKKDTAAS